ncbi:unnamed protein product, partial [Protopolystoma xenopodis]
MKAGKNLSAPLNSQAWSINSRIWMRLKAAELQFMKYSDQFPFVPPPGSSKIASGATQPLCMSGLDILSRQLLACEIYAKPEKVSLELTREHLQTGVDTKKLSSTTTNLKEDGDRNNDASSIMSFGKSMNMEFKTNHTPKLDAVQAKQVYSPDRQLLPHDPSSPRVFQRVALTSDPLTGGSTSSPNSPGSNIGYNLLPNKCTREQSDSKSVTSDEPLNSLTSAHGVTPSSSFSSAVALVSGGHLLRLCRHAPISVEEVRLAAHIVVKLQTQLIIRLAAYLLEGDMQGHCDSASRESEGLRLLSLLHWHCLHLSQLSSLSLGLIWPIANSDPGSEPSPHHKTAAINLWQDQVFGQLEFINNCPGFTRLLPGLAMDLLWLVDQCMLANKHTNCNHRLAEDCIPTVPKAYHGNNDESSGATLREAFLDLDLLGKLCLTRHFTGLDVFSQDKLYIGRSKGSLHETNASANSSINSFGVPEATMPIINNRSEQVLLGSESQVLSSLMSPHNSVTKNDDEIIVDLKEEEAKEDREKEMKQKAEDCREKEAEHTRNEKEDDELLNKRNEAVVKEQTYLESKKENEATRQMSKAED